MSAALQQAIENTERDLDEVVRRMRRMETMIFRMAVKLGIDPKERQVSVGMAREGIDAMSHPAVPDVGPRVI